MTQLDHLYAVDDRVRAFENHQTGLLVSLAGPGTGKTYSFLRRIDALVLQNRAQPEEICYLTFIKAIAKAFTVDYNEEHPANIGDEDPKPKISTLHSLACRIIRNRGFSIGYDGELYFANIADKDVFASKIFLNDLFPFVQSHGFGSVPKLRVCIMQAKEAWRDNEDIHAMPDPVPIVTDTTVRLARAYRLVDWDQTISLAHELFLNPQNRDEWLTRLQHFLIDEYQDFNRAEQAFITSIASTITSMVIVGDDNQSIFSGRGGLPEGMRNLFSSPDYDQVSLLRCRRCKVNILNAANRFLRWMSPTASSMLPYADGGAISCHSFKSAKAEIAYLIDYLNGRIAELPENLFSKDGIICLFPSRKSLKFYYDKLNPAVPSYTNRVESEAIRRKIELFLELVANPNQRFIERIILEDEIFTSITVQHKRKMVEDIFQNDISPTEAINSLIASGFLTGDAATAGNMYIALCQSLSSQEPSRIANTIALYFERNEVDLRPIFEDMMNRLGDTDQEDLISGVCDKVLPEFAMPEENSRSVLFLTMQGSKGLTKKTVVLPGLEQAWLPGSSDGEELEEKKRLFYVSITRATDNVLITYPRSRAPGDELNFPIAGRGIASTFIRQAGIRDSYHA